MQTLDECIHDYLDGRANDAAVAWLSNILESDPAACRRYLELASVHAALSCDEALRSVPAEPATPALWVKTELPNVSHTPVLAPLRPTPLVQQASRIQNLPLRPSPIFPRWLGAAAAILLMGALVFFAVSRNSPLQPESATSVTTSPAILRETNAAVWDDPSLAVGSRVPVGSLQLKSGYAVLEFARGTVMALRGPATVNLHSPMEVECRSGTMRFFVPPESSGFVARTPNVRIVDIGTEFGLRVVNGADDVVKVLHGIVELQAGGQKSALNTGQAVTVNPAGKLTARILHDTEFPQLPPQTSLASGSESRFQAWRALEHELSSWPGLLIHYPCERRAQEALSLDNTAPKGRRGTFGTLQNVSWSSGRWPGSQALGFAGSAGRVRFIYDKPLQNCTLAAWVQVDSSSKYPQALFASDGTSPGALVWEILRSGQIRLHVRNTLSDGKRFESVTPAILPNSFPTPWTHLAVTLENGMIQHYVNGARIQSDQCVGLNSVIIGKACLGNWLEKSPKPAFSRPFSGKMDDVLLFDRALSPAQIARISQTGQP